MPKIAIIGAGINGLAIAYDLQSQGYECTLLEKSNRIGGAICSTEHSSGFRTEDGPHSLLLNSNKLEAFIHSFEVLKQSLISTNPQAQNRFILKNNQLHPIQPKPFSLLTSNLLPFKSRIKLLSELLQPPKERLEDISIREFFIQHFDHEFVDYLLDPFIAGTYAGDPSRLSAQSTFPKLFEYEVTYGSILKGLLVNKSPYKNRIVSFKDGLSSLPKAIAQKLKNKPIHECKILLIKYENNQWTIRFQSGSTDTRCMSFDAIYFTIPAFAISKLPFDESVKNHLPKFDSVDHPPVSVLSLGFHKSEIQHPMNGLGYLTPKIEKTNHLGALFVSKMFPNRAPEDHELISFFIGGSRNPDYASPDTEKLISMLTPTLENLLGITARPTFAYQRFWEQSIPQYSIGHQKLIQSIENFEKQFPGLKFEGNYRKGIALNQAIV
jgi:oxygen-dependent protoporphyrinogen oxidase